MFLPRSENPTRQPRLGAHGVRYKRFEEVVAELLSKKDIIVKFVQIPRPPIPYCNEAEWPFHLLPQEARVMGNCRGQLQGIRAVRKENQIRCMIQCVLAMMNLENHDQEKVEIVDFGGGSGHLAIPLALLLPCECNVTIVDLKAASLQFVHEKALQFCTDEHKSGECDDIPEMFKYPKNKQLTDHDHIKRKCLGIPNLFTFHGSINSYKESFDIGVSLHACGEASDLVLRACGEESACIVVAPCCVGKLNEKTHDPYVYHATGENRATITYPQSSAFREILSIDSTDAWNALAKAADYSDWDEMRSARNATRRTAKALLETDRTLFLKERYHYQTALTRMDPWESSPKHDIILAWPSEKWSPFHSTYAQGIPDSECQADIKSSLQFLLQRSASFSDTDGETDLVDWTLEERKLVEQKIRNFIDSNDQVFSFPAGMGKRKRKLVHYVAEQMGLSHWGAGKRASDKIVIVGKKDRFRHKSE